MKKLFLLTGIFALMSISTLKAQVTIGANVEPDPSAVLDLQSNGNMGLLLPRVILTDTLVATPLKAHVQGMLVYNTTPSDDGKVVEGIYYNDGRRWWQANIGAENVISQPQIQGTYWSLTGNEGTNSANFIGTTDNTPLILKVNNQPAGFTGYDKNSNVSFGYLSLQNTSAGSDNTALGARALSLNETGISNVAIGTQALELLIGGYNNVAIGVEALSKSPTPGSDNVAIGYQALMNNTYVINTKKGLNNTVVGSQAAKFNTEGEGITAMGYRTLYNNTTGSYNTALGYQTLLQNTTGGWNVALGAGSLQNNTTGKTNTAGGYASLHNNQDGLDNTAFGYQALEGNISRDHNTAVGTRALRSINSPLIVDDATKDYGNTAVGYEALREITTGTLNVGIGMYSLKENSTGNSNVAVGNEALSNNTTGDGNFAIGYQALLNNTTGNNNIAIGYGADVSGSDFNNATAIGYGAIATASNQVMIGNGDVTRIGGYAPWTTISDGRVKKNIKQNVPGLEFINLLQPVTYNLNLDAADNIIRAGQTFSPKARELQQKRVHTGFVAQDVEKAAQSIGYDFSGVDAAENENSLYGLRYSEFIMPLIKAVQELSAENKAKDAIIASSQEQVKELTRLVNRLLEEKKLISK